MLIKAIKAHSENHPELVEALQLIEDLFKNLKIHLNKEETILFPLIKYLEDCKRFEEKPHLGKNKSTQKTINALGADHQFAGEVTEKIRELLNDFKAPIDACTTYELLLQKLDNFEKDLHMHVHLENNVLFPKAVELENYLHTTYQR
jgi:regulator of cell morphogenesis and NO signaling